MVVEMAEIDVSATGSSGLVPDVPTGPVGVAEDSLLGELLCGRLRGSGFEGASFIDAVAHDSKDSLTPSEQRVFELLSHGRSNGGIAKELFVSERTVEVHVRHIFSKLGLPSDASINRRVVAALMFHQHAD